jgi:hypothetical protein
MSALGYNSLRVFIDLCRDTFCIGDVDGGLKSEYMDNLVWFLERAREYEIFVILTANWIPDVGGYIDGVYEACGDQFDLGNCLLLTEKGVSGYQRYFKDLICDLRERDAILDVDTSALVTCGFFAPNSPNPIRGDNPTRLVPFKALLDHSELDFLDIHTYPGDYPWPNIWKIMAY